MSFGLCRCPFQTFFPTLSSVDSPTITTQPQDKLNITPGTDATFTLTAAGLRLNYAWKQGDGSKLPSDDRFVPNNEILTIHNIQPSDVGSYHCVVSNPAGSITSYSARLTLSELHDCVCV